MDRSGPRDADRPQADIAARRSPPGAHGRVGERASGEQESEQIRRLLTPVQRLKCSVIPGAVSGWARSLRRWPQGQPELQGLVPYIDPHRTAIDVGANAGTYTWFLSRLCRHVYAYEPNPATRWLLTRSAPANVTVFARALSDQCGEAVLRIPRIAGRFANHVGTLRPVVDTSACEQIAVSTTRLDDDGLVDVGFLKIDVAGHEQEVLDGAREIMARDQPVLQIVVRPRQNPQSAGEMIESVERLGYRTLAVENDQWLDWSAEGELRAGRARHGDSAIGPRTFLFLPMPATMTRAA